MRARNRLGPLCASSLLVPDITPSARLSQAAAEAAKKKAFSLSPIELGCRAVIEVVVVSVVAWAVRWLVIKLSGKAKKVLEGQAAQGRISVAAAVSEGAVAAAAAPCKLLLPLAAGAYVVRVAVLALEIVIHTEVHKNKHIAKHVVEHGFQILTALDQGLQDTSQVAVICFLCWFFLAWKQQLVDAVSAVARKVKEEGDGQFGLERVVLPFSALAGWGIVAVGLLSSLTVLGINVQPLLTVGGVGGLALGFGAQAVTSNAISGINLFLTRPFVVGDRVELKGTGGASVIVGVVERIDPMHTVVRTDDSVPVSIPNKAITEMMVSNESRLGTPLVVSGFKDPRRYSNIISLPVSDFPKVPLILSDLRDFLVKHPGVDKSLPHSAILASMNSSTITIGITAHTTAIQSREFGAFNAELLMETAKVLGSHGAAPFAAAS